MVLSPLNKEKIFNFVAPVAFFFSIGLVAAVLFFLVNDSMPILECQLLRFLTGTSWHSSKGYGALPMIYGTLTVTFLAICLALPLGLGSAIVTSEILSGRLRLIVKAIIELLAGIPGVVYGLLGIFFVAPAIKNAFGLIDGNSIFTAGVILSIMILPTVMTLSDDALRSVPRKYREQAVSLGLNRRETIVHAVFPLAMKGVIAGVLLSLGRAMGETVAVMMVIGSVDKIPKPFFNIFEPGQTITSKIGREASDALGVGLHWNALVGLGLILFIMIMLITLFADMIITSPKRLDI